MYIELQLVPMQYNFEEMPYKISLVNNKTHVNKIFLMSLMDLIALTAFC